MLHLKLRFVNKKCYRLDNNFSGREHLLFAHHNSLIINKLKEGEGKSCFLDDAIYLSCGYIYLSYIVLST